MRLGDAYGQAAVSVALVGIDLPRGGRCVLNTVRAVDRARDRLNLVAEGRVIGVEQLEEGWLSAASATASARSVQPAPPSVKGRHIATRTFIDSAISVIASHSDG